MDASQGSLSFDEDIDDRVRYVFKIEFGQDFFMDLCRISGRRLRKTTSHGKTTDLVCMLKRKLRPMSR